MFANQFSPPVLLHSYNAHTGAAKTWKFFLPLLVEHSARLWPRRTFRICCHGYYLCTLFSLPYVYHPEYCEVMSCCIQQGHALKLYKEALKIVYRFVNVTCIANKARLHFSLTHNNNDHLIAQKILWGENHLKHTENLRKKTHPPLAFCTFVNVCICFLDCSEKKDNYDFMILSSFLSGLERNQHLQFVKRNLFIQWNIGKLAKSEEHLPA